MLIACWIMQIDLLKKTLTFNNKVKKKFEGVTALNNGGEMPTNAFESEEFSLKY